MAAMLRDSPRHRRRAHAPTRNTAGHDNMRKSIHGFPLSPYMGMELHYEINWGNYQETIK